MQRLIAIFLTLLLAPAAFLIGSARPAAAQECWFVGCGSGWGWGLVGAVAYDDNYDGDPWYDDGEFGAGEVALTLMAIELIARSANHNSYAYDDQVYDNQTYDTQAYDKQVYDQQVYDQQAYDMQTNNAQVITQTLDDCDRYVISHREYRYCADGAWYGRIFLWQWGQVPTPAGVVVN